MRQTRIRHRHGSLGDDFLAFASHGEAMVKLYLPQALHMGRGSKNSPSDEPPWQDQTQHRLPHRNRLANLCLYSRAGKTGGGEDASHGKKVVAGQVHNLFPEGISHVSVSECGEAAAPGLQLIDILDASREGRRRGEGRAGRRPARTWEDSADRQIGRKCSSPRPSSVGERIAPCH